MPTITLDTPTHNQLRLVASALGVSESAAVAELLRRMADAAPAEVEDDGKVPIHVVYNGTRIEAHFEPATGTIEILTPPLDGQVFKSPSRAAIEVVRLLKPGVNPNRNGWGFWIISRNGQPLASIR